MNKMDFKRIFLKDEHNQYYRIFSIANEKDHKGEYYVKIIFPDIKNIPLITSKNDDEGTITETDFIIEGVSEFSYHYRAGISHFKNSLKRIDQKRNAPTLFDNPALRLFRFVLYSLKSFNIQDVTKITEKDFVLPIVFDGKARGFELVISKILGKLNATNIQGKDPVHTYKIILEDKNVSFHIADCLWNRPPSVKGTPLFEIFRYDDPANNISVNNLKI
jgi:hypothetical protein